MHEVVYRNILYQITNAKKTFAKLIIIIKIMIISIRLQASQIMKLAATRLFAHQLVQNSKKKSIKVMRKMSMFQLTVHAIAAQVTEHLPADVP